MTLLKFEEMMLTKKHDTSSNKMIKKLGIETKFQKRKSVKLKNELNFENKNTKTQTHADVPVPRLLNSMFPAQLCSQHLSLAPSKVSEQFDIEKVTLRHNIGVNSLITGKLIGDLENP